MGHVYHDYVTLPAGFGQVIVLSRPESAQSQELLDTIAVRRSQRAERNSCNVYIDR